MDALRDVIVFSGPHNFVSGDAVRYDDGGDLMKVVAGLNENLDGSGIFYVRRIDERTIKLAQTSAAATAPLHGVVVGPSLITGGNTFDVATHGFSEGALVTHRAPAQVGFNSKAVDWNGDTDPTHPYGSADNNVIFLGEDTSGDGIADVGLAANLQTGDRVTYRTDNAALGIGGLTNGGVYYVINIDSFHIRLSDTPDGTDTDDSGPLIGVLPLAADKTDAGVAVRHLLVPQALGGLQHGVTYSVHVLNANQFQLSNVGSALVLGVSLGSATGTHFFTREGMDLVSTGNSNARHSLRLDFASTQPNQTNLLLGPNGNSLRTVTAPTGDGRSSATAKGGAFGFAGIDIPTAEANFTAHVQAYNQADLIDADGDVTITSHSAGQVSAYAQSASGGFIGIGRSRANIHYNNANSSYVGGGGSVDVVAGGNVVVRSTSEIMTNVGATAEAGAFIGVSDAGAGTRVDSATNVRIGSNATISGRTVDLNAAVIKLQPIASARAIAGGFAGAAIATADNDVHSTTNVLLEGTNNSDTRIAALQGMDIHATHTGTRFFRSTEAHFYGLFGGPDENGDNHGALTNTIDSDRGEGDPGDFDFGDWHIACHLLAAGGVRRSSDNRLLWLEISHEFSSDRYFASVSVKEGARTLTVPIMSADGESLLRDSTLLGFVEGNSTGQISAAGVNDPSSRFNLWKRQVFDQPVESPRDGGKV